MESTNQATIGGAIGGDQKERALPPDVLFVELTAFLEYLSTLGIDWCVLHPFPERGCFSAGDVDLRIEPGGIASSRKYLLGHGWEEEPHFRFRSRRHFFSKQWGLFRLQLDISTVY